MKAIIKIIGFVLLCVAFASCRQTTNLNTNAGYKDLIGKNYVLVVNLPVFTSQDDTENYVIGHFGSDGIPDESEMPEAFPYTPESVAIHGVLNNDITFTIQSIDQHKTFEQDMIVIKVKVNGGEFEGRIMDATLLSDYQRPPKILSEYAVEVVAK